MIPASYFYRDAYVRNWGDPGNPAAEAATEEPRQLGPGHWAGLAALLAAVVPLRLERGRRIGHA